MPPTTDPSQRWRVAVPLPKDEDLPADIVHELSQNPPLNVTRMFAGTLDMAPGVMALIHAVFYAEGIDPRLRQIIILRVAQLLDCTYEWQANVVFAKNVGLTDQQIAQVGIDDEVTGLGPTEDLICRATDEITTDGSLTRTFQ
ncbi:MAG: carboxymuconolactone decarboxylase family protein [Acidimicrobiales bacterium]|jgi:alkylhydroperoxidase family enzyme